MQVVDSVGGRVRAVAFSHGFDTAIITFDHWVAGKTNFIDPKEAQWIKKREADQIVIQTSTNDRYRNEDLIPTLRAIAPILARYKRIHAVAFSMGCIAAIRLAHHFPVDTICLVSPRRTSALFEALGAGVVRCPTAVLFDPTLADDRAAVEKIADFADDFTYVSVPEFGHPASEGFRRIGKLGWLLAEATSPYPLGSLLCSGSNSPIVGA